MADTNTTDEVDRTRAVRHLRELIAAIDRRVPHSERRGETAIARDAAVLRREASDRIARLEAPAPRIKTRGARFELWSVAGALIVGMFLVMWAQSPSDGCTLSPEAPRHLVLSRQTDREHLSIDLASVDRIARQYAASTPDADQQPSRFTDCQATLLQQIVNLHGVAPAQLHVRPQ